MKKVMMFAMVGMILLAALAGCSSKTVKVDDSMNGQTITVKQGETIVVTLAGNPTTGFGWTVKDLDTTILSQIGDYSYKADSNLIGAGGVFTYQFKAEAAGTTTLKLDYARSWETDVAPEQTFAVTVVVE
jgi:inhibitor of cysteine peptidase